MSKYIIECKGEKLLPALIAIILGFGSLIVAYVLEEGKLSALVSLSPVIIVFGGTFAAIMLSFPMEYVKKMPKILKIIFAAKPINFVEKIAFFKDLGFKTRKNGLLSLEGELSGDDIDPFVKKGLQMIVDGVEPATVRGILELEADMTSERHKMGASIFDAAGGYSPTMGIIGTVMGLVQVLGNLSDPSSLGPKIAVAFIATLYGVGFANLLWLPFGARLKAIDKEEANEKNLIIEAILLIQEGVNPNTIAEKLKGFLNKEELAKYEAADGKVAE